MLCSYCHQYVQDLKTWNFVCVRVPLLTRAVCNVDSQLLFDFSALCDCLTTFDTHYACVCTCLCVSVCVYVCVSVLVNKEFVTAS